MKIIKNHVSNMALTFDNGYTASVTQKQGSTTHSWIAYWSTKNGDCISVNEWVMDDTVAAFIAHVRQLEPAHMTMGVQHIIAQSIMNKFGG